MITKHRVSEIDDMLAELRTLWIDHPEQRLGQLICNLTRDEETGSLKSSGSIFNVADRELESRIVAVNKDGWMPVLKTYSTVKVNR